MDTDAFTDHALKLASAVSHLYTRDLDLLSGDIQERCVCFKIAHYLADKYKAEGGDSPLKVDCEYNKADDKGWQSLPADDLVFDENGSVLCPDIIVHSGKENNSNVIMMEIRKKQSDILPDSQKLADFTNAGSNQRYRYGIRLVLEEKNISNVLVYVDGKDHLRHTQTLKDSLSFHDLIGAAS